MAPEDWLEPVLMILAGAGASNWALVEFLNFNLVETITFGIDPLAMAAYLLAGIAGVSGVWSGTKMLMDQLG
jgi:uncharacterized membrane protein YuzA (DUF378 family)